jgi:hypothetical protein
VATSRAPVSVVSRGAVCFGGTDIGDDENWHPRLSGALDRIQLTVRFGLLEPAISDHEAKQTPRLRQVPRGFAN